MTKPRFWISVNLSDQDQDPEKARQAINISFYERKKETVTKHEFWMKG